MEIVERARQLADDVLFPAALATDAAEVVPVELLDALAEAGLYGLSGPVEAGGLDADFATVCAVVEALAGGCLTTAFVWTQHLGTVHAVTGAAPALRGEWLEPLCRGERRAGLSLGGALPRPTLHARPAGEGWTFDGTSAWVSGWGRIDVVHTAARSEDGRLVWALVDARESESLHVEPLELAALQATATVRIDLRDLPVPPARVTTVMPSGPAATPPEVLRIHAAFALGVAGRCCRLLGASPLDEELARCRAELDRLDPETIEPARAAAGELALRAAAALTTLTGSRALVRREHAQRLAREALFTLVYALRPAGRAAVLGLLRAAG